MATLCSKQRRGFTLIELLVVIAIIGLLSSVVLASLNTARAKARDARRVSDAKQVQTALEFYYNDYGHYPSYVETGSGDGGWDNSGMGDGFITGLTGSNVRGDNPNGTVYMSQTPTDPQNDTANAVCGQSYGYLTVTNDASYRFVIHPESASLSGYTYDTSLCPGKNTIIFSS